MTLLSEPNDHETLMNETIGYAIIDSGCTQTVCGNTWLDTYLDTLSNKLRRSTFSQPAKSHFRFGDGKLYTSDRIVTIPVQFGSQSAKLMTHVINCDIPLLMSRFSLKRANSHLDFLQDKIMLLGEEVTLKISSSGHYCIKLINSSDRYDNTLVSQTLFTSPISSDDENSRRKVLKLHKQFAHPSSERLKQLIQNSGVKDDKIFNLVDEISRECDICKRYRKPSPRPVVGFPLASEFNEMVAMDIKYINTVPVLHMIDHATRYSSACLLKNKKPLTVIEAVMTHWIQIFGQPQKVLTDNGGEFVNSELLELAEKFNITLKTTAAESAWSNGLCERHNAVISDLASKVMADSRCTLNMAVPWAISAKNSLSNVYGFSPNQLVFGRNSNYPTVHLDKPPAQNLCSNDFIAKHLIALHKARQAFTAQESCEKLRRALNKQTRNYSNTVYNNGDEVYYKRKNSAEWHGPAKVLGKDGAQHLLKHGGIYIRVHPCKMQLTKEPVYEMKDYNQMVDTDKQSEQQTINKSVQQDYMYNSSEDESSESQPSVTQPIAIPENSTSDHEQNHDQKKKVPRALARLMDCNKPGLKELSDTQQNDNESTEEIFFGHMSDSSRFDEAKSQELQKWRDMGVYTEVTDTGQSRISTRWVCTEKMKGGKNVFKARLVARGFEEDSSQLRSDSPTCTKESLRMLLCILAAKKWKLQSIDIKSAYLQGCPISRDLYLQPPDCANTSKLWKLIKTPYGLVDAGRKWYIRVMKEFTNLGAQQAPCDQAVFVWSDPSGKESCGILVAHVDDFLYGGNDYFIKNILPKIRSTFIVGTEENRNLKYIGLHIVQTLYSIFLSNNIYTEGLVEIDTTNIGSDRSQSLTKEETSQVKSVIGQINWITNQTRPDIAFDNCFVANSIKNATIADLLHVNKVIRKARSQKVFLKYPSSLDLSSCQMISFCDASFANLPDRGSQGGNITFIVDQRGIYCPIAWQSKRIKRVVNSTLAAECLEAVNSAEICILLRSTLETFLCCPKNSIKITIISDNKSLVDAAHTTTSVEGKRLQIEISILREMIQKGDINQFKWIETKYQVANPLTKIGASSEYLLNILRRSMKYNLDTGIFS